MNPIVFAMRRPLTVMVLVVALALASGLAVYRMSIDIFPNLNLPVVYVCQPYGGMDPAQMEGLLTNYYEYHFLYINGIHHVESRNIQGMALMKLYFHPGTNMAQAMAETIGYVTRARAFMPPGTVSPFVMRFDVGSIPVGYLVLRSDTKSIGEIQDEALFKVRPMFASLPGVSAPPPFGGSQRTVVVRVDPDRLRAYKMSPDEVIGAIEAGNFISPSGNVRIDDTMPIVPINSLVKEVKDLETIPIRPGEDPTVYIRDVGTVHDASDIPTGYALANGRRAVYILVTKRADASTLSVVNNVKKALPSMQAVLPPDIKVSFEFDQSPTVTRSMWTVLTEGLMGAGLTGLMVLLFLRDWRSVIVVVLNIPFALCGALVGLWLTGQSINLMTLGGLALAIGILVDESTVEVENIHQQMEGSRSVARSVRRGNQQTAVPRLLAMLCVLAVFIPSFFMQGAARSLFVPLSLAVGFAMVTSYLLSSTFVPVLSTWLLRHHPLAAHRRMSLFERLQAAYAKVVGGFVRLRWLVVPAYLAAAAAAIVLVGLTLGWEIFPKVDAGRFQLRLHAPDGTRYEKTEELALTALRTIEDEIGKDNVEATVGYVGLIPSSYPINAIFQWTSGPQDGILRIALKNGSKVDLEAVKERLRDRLSHQLPGVRLSFEPADIVSEVMSFGSPTPVEVSVNGPSLAENRAYAEKVRQELARVPSLRDLQYGLSLDYPTVSIEIDRERAGLSGVTARDVARSVVAATSSSRFVVPNYWPDPKSGIGYQVQVEIPYQIMNSLAQMETVPIQRPGLDRQVLLRDVATLREGTEPGQYDRYNMKRTVSLTANIAGEDLGRVAGHVRRALGRAGEPPKGATVEIRGQVRPMDEILQGLSFGLLASIIVILLLLTANFQSVKLALVVVSTAPAVVAGVVLNLWLTGTSINLQSFNGAIMAIGVAVANAILLVTFAEQHRRDEGMEAGPAAVAGARGRLRPILMTSCAMIAGMVPMAIGWGEQGGQTAPLGRAVIGGLAAATLATLFVLPTVFALVQGWAGRQSASLDPDDPASPHYHEEQAEERELALARGNGDARTVPFGLLLLISLVPLVAQTGCDRAIEGQTGAGEKTVSPVRAVEIVHPERRTIRREVGEPGQLQAFETTPIHAKVAGYVKRWCLNIGDAVKKGQLLAELFDPELEAELKQRQAMIDQAVAKHELAQAAVKVAEADVQSAKAKLGEVRAGVSRAEADVARWQAEYKRVEQLHRERALTGSLVDETLSKLRSAEAAREEIGAHVKTAEAALVQSHAGLEQARAEVAASVAPIEVARQDAHRVEAMLSYTRIEAPYDGIVTARNVDTGELTHPGADSPPLFVVSRSDIVTIKVDVPETYATEVNPGDRAQVTLQAMKNKVVEGKVTRTSWSLDPRTRTIRVEIDIPNPGGALRPGLYAYATIIVEEHANVITLPTTTLFRENDKDYCVLVVDGKVLRKQIQVGLSDGIRTEIVSGLDGEASALGVVRASASSLTDGQPVQIEQAAK